VAKWRR